MELQKSTGGMHMSILERYYGELDKRGAEEKEKADRARMKGDEREHSIHLMQQSMLGDMLKVLGRVEHEGQRPGILAAQIENLKKEEARQLAQGDHDSADRARIKAETIDWAMQTLRELERSHE